MKQYLVPFLVGAGLVIMTLVSFLIGKEAGWQKGYDDAMNLPHKPDTVVVEKPVYIEKPVEVVKWRDREKLVYVDVHDTTEVHHYDTTYIALNREYKQYREETFEAQVSGVDPSLDWIRVNQKTEYITNTVIKQPKWSFAITAGPSIMVDFKGEVHAGGAVTVGISRNIK